MGEAPASSIDTAEIERFSAIAADWWNPTGKFAPLHKFNPVRLQFIRDEAALRFGRDARTLRPFEGLTLLDIGCGGGLLCEPMSRMGFAVTGVDASQRTIGAASAHAAENGLSIDYRQTTAEDLLASGAGPYDVVLTMEVIEHVADPGRFLRDCTRLLKPGGLMVVATLNRTPKALALAVIGAEHILRWLPVGTHDWKKFLKPHELLEFLRDEPVTVEGPFGVAFDLVGQKWVRSADVAVNYMMTVKA